MYKLIIIFLTSICLTGCFFHPPQEVNYYDLAFPAELPMPNIHLTIAEFDNNSGAGQKMRYRLDGNRQIIDNLNKWSHSPENMIRQYLVSAMTGYSGSSPNDKQLLLYGRLELFEIDLTAKEIIMQFAYALAPREAAGYFDLNWKVHRFQTQLKDNSPLEFARAFSTATGELSKAIRNEIIKKH